MEKFASKKKEFLVYKTNNVEKSKQQEAVIVLLNIFIYALFCIYNKLQLSLRLHLTWPTLQCELEI